MLDVVSVAPPVGTVAAGVLAMAVAGDQSSPHGRGDDATSATDVEGLGVGSKDHAAEVAIAGVAADLSGRQHFPVARLVDAPAVPL
jgi:hypothetical protein